MMTARVAEVMDHPHMEHVSAEMSLRYGRLFDATVRAEYERALELVKGRLGSIPLGRTRLPLPGDGDWRGPLAVKTVLAGGFCVRATVQGACPYANICEHCPGFRTDTGNLPVLAAQRSDAVALRPTPSPAAGPPRPTGTAASSPGSTRSSPRPRRDDDGGPSGARGDGTGASGGRGSRDHLHDRRRGGRHRARQIDTRTLSGLHAEIAHLRTALEAVAARATAHEERLRRLERPHAVDSE